MRRGLKFTLIGCGGLIALVVLVSVIGAIVGGGEVAEQPQQQQQEEPAEQEQQQEQQQEEGAQEPEPEPEEEEPRAQPAIEPIEFSGSSPQATDPFQLEPGLAIIRMTHQGDANFIVDLLDESGQSVAPMGIANEIGPFDGSIAVPITGDQHILDVDANGPWTIRIEQPRPTSAPQTATFRGTGKTATKFFELSEGLHRFTMRHQGDANFIVDLLNRDGVSVVPMGLVNEIGPFEGSTAASVPEDGIYLLQVEANGPWTITIE